MSAFDRKQTFIRGRSRGTGPDLYSFVPALKQLRKAMDKVKPPVAS